MTSQQHHELPTTTLNRLSNAFTILIVDDMKANRMLLERLLARVGYQTIEAEDGESALRQVSTYRPDMVILDVEMPGMNGIQAANEIRSSELGAERLPIIIASGNANDEMSAEALKAGGDVFLTKPFDFDNLLSSMRSLLKDRQSTARNVCVSSDQPEERQSAPNSLSVKL